MPILSAPAIQQLGFLSVGDNVRISDKASFHNAGKISIGNNVRIDDFCVLSAGVGGIRIGNFVHIAVGSTLIGAGEIVISDFGNISSRVSIFSSSDDYSGDCMTNPMVPAEFTGVVHARVFLDKHVILGCGSVVLPGVTLGEGVAVGALSLVRSSCPPFGIYAGSPARRIKERSRKLLDVEQAFMAALSSSGQQQAS